MSDDAMLRFICMYLTFMSGFVTLAAYVFGMWLLIIVAVAFAATSAWLDIKGRRRVAPPEYRP